MNYLTNRKQRETMDSRENEYTHGIDCDWRSFLKDVRRKNKEGIAENSCEACKVKNG